MKVTKLNIANFYQYITPNNQIGHDSDGVIYKTPYGLLKLFDDSIPANILERKESICNSLAISDITPNIIVAHTLLYNNRNFRGYIFSNPPGIPFKDAISKVSLPCFWEIVKEIEKIMKILHRHNIYIQNLTENKIKVYGKQVYLLYTDECCMYERYRLSCAKIKYPCPYTRMISKISDIFSLRLLVVLSLTGELNDSINKYNLTFLTRHRLKKKIKKLDIPRDIKLKLLQIFERNACRNLTSYLF